MYVYICIYIYMYIYIYTMNSVLFPGLGAGANGTHPSILKLWKRGQNTCSQEVGDTGTGCLFDPCIYLQQTQPKYSNFLAMPVTRIATFFGRWRPLLRVLTLAMPMLQAERQGQGTAARLDWWPTGDPSFWGLGDTMALVAGSWAPPTTDGPWDVMMTDISWPEFGGFCIFFGHVQNLRKGEHENSGWSFFHQNQGSASMSPAAGFNRLPKDLLLTEICNSNSI